MVTDKQVRLLRKKRMESKTWEAAAMAAGMTEKTARKWERGALPSATTTPRTWRTRPDPFEDVWAAEVEPLLLEDKDGKLEAKTIFDELCRHHPTTFEGGQLRTLQRRVRVWRAEQGPEKEVFFPQQHVAGKMASIDFTHATELGEQDERLVVARGREPRDELEELEADARKERRVDRLRRASKLPPAKSFDSLERERVPRAVFLKVQQLATGDFLDCADNVLLFGLPGVGKSHLACALGHALVEAGRSVLFTPTYQLVQTLLAARRDLVLPKALRALDAFDAVILDDLGYVQQTADEAEVLFTLMAERYERRSLIITSNLVFSEWNRIFKSPMTTAAAIDRLVHHASIIEIDRDSVRAEGAKKNNTRKKNDDGT